MAISMLKIRRPLGRLFFNMGIAIPVKTIFLIETAPWCLRGRIQFITSLLAPSLTPPNFLYPRFNEVERGVYWYHLVRLSVCGQNRVRSVSSTILIGSLSYLHILSSNFRRCVACKCPSQNSKIWNFDEFFKFVTLTLSSFDLGSNMTQWYG